MVSCNEVLLLKGTYSIYIIAQNSKEKKLITHGTMAMRWKIFASGFGLVSSNELIINSSYLSHSFTQE